MARLGRSQPQTRINSQGPIVGPHLDPTIPFSVTPVGGIINDATRTINRDGDGRTVPDSSFGLWRASTNLLVNGGFEGGLSLDWVSAAASKTVVTSTMKFGLQSLQLTTNGSGPGEGVETFTLPSVSSSTVYTASCWVNAPIGATLALRAVGNVSADASQNFVGTGAWQRVTLTLTTGPSDTTLDVGVKTITTAQGIVFYIDGVQLEQQPYATPYIETDGATATRAAGYVTAPARVLSTAQGWVAIRLRADQAASAISSAINAVYVQSTAPGNFASIGYNGASGQFETGGAGATTLGAGTFVKDDYITLILAWTASSTKGSVSGGTFTSVGVAPSGTIGNFFLGADSAGAGQWDGEILWVAAGTGTLTDADAATINARGNVDDPTGWPTLSGATFFWACDTVVWVVPSVVASAAFVARPTDTNLLAIPAALARQRRQTRWRLRAPTVVSPAQVFSGPQVNSAAGLNTNQRRAQQRTPRQGWVAGVTQTTGSSVQTWGNISYRNGPSPPELILPLPNVRQQTVTVASQAVGPRRNTEQRRKPFSLLRAPAVISTATFVASPVAVNLAAGIATNQRRLVSRRTASRVFPPPVLQTFGGPQVNLLPADRFNRSHRRHPPASVLQPPFFYAQTSTIRATLVKTRPRSKAAVLRPPTVLQTFSGPAVHTVRIRPTRTHVALTAPTTLQVFAGPKVALVRARPRHTISLLPLTIVVATVAFVARPVQTNTVANRSRVAGRKPRSFLASPTVLQTFSGPPTKLVRTLPRQTSAALAPPLVINPLPSQQQQTIQTRLVTIPRATRRYSSRLAGPIVVSSAVFIASPVQVSVVENRTRVFGRRLSRSFVAPPTVLATFAGPRVATTRIRPRRTIVRLGPPTVLQTFQAGRVALVKIRPRATIVRLYPPATLQEFFGPIETEVAVRTLVEQRRHLPHSHLAPPTVVSTPAAAFYGPSVHLVATRPRKIVSRLQPPFFYAQTSEIAVHTVRIRPRPTSRFLYAPTVLSTFVGPEEKLVRTRPRATVSRLSSPAVVTYPPVETVVHVSLTKTRPRPTVHALGLPTVLQTFSGPDVVLARIRPRPTFKAIFPPTKLLVASIEAQLRTIEVKLVQTRPRPTTKDLRPPTVIVINPPVVTTIASEQVVVRTRLEQKRHFPLQGFRQRLIRETGSAVGIGMQGFDPLLGPRPPQIVDPLPTQREQTVKTTLAAVRTRAEQKRHYPLPGFEGQLVRETGTGVSFIQSLWKPLLGVKPPTIIGPLPTQAQQTVLVKAVALRTGVEQQRHAPFFVLYEPAVIAAAQPSRQQQTITVESVAIRRAAENVRHAPHSRQIAPVSYPATSTISVTNVAIQTRLGLQRRAARYFLTNISYEATSEIGVRLVATQTRADVKRRAAHWFLAKPTVVIVPSVEQQEETIRVATVRTRPRPTSRFLSKPTVLQTFSGPTVVLARIRPRPTTTILSPPQVVTYAPVVTTITVRLAGRTRVEQQRRASHSKLSYYAFKATSQIRVVLTRTRPRPITTRLAPPTVVTIFQARKTVVATVATRPRATTHFLRQPTVLLVPSVQQQQRTIRVTLTRTRPQPTTTTLRPPVIVRVPSVEQLQQTVRVTLTKTRPRPTTTILPGPVATPPLVTTIFGAQVVARPFPTTRQLHAPTVVNRFKITRGVVVQTNNDSTVESNPSCGTVTATIRGSLVTSQQSDSSVEIGAEEGTVEQE